MKSIILILSFLLSYSALALDTTKLGSMTEYTCIVEIKTVQPTAYFITQTCDSQKTQVIDTIADNPTSAAKLQVEVIEAMRPKGLHLVTQSTSSSEDESVLSMVFQKRDL